MPRCASCSTWSAHAGIRQFRDLRRTRPERWTPPNDGVPVVIRSKPAPRATPLAITRRGGEPNPRPGPAARWDPTSAGVSVRLPRPVSALPGTVFGVRDHAPGDRVLRGNVSPCPATTRERHHHRRRRRFQSPHDVCALAQCSPLHLQLIAELIAGIHASAIRRPPRCHPHSILCHRGSSSPRQIVRAIWFGTLPFSMLFWLSSIH